MSFLKRHGTLIRHALLWLVVFSPAFFTADLVSQKAVDVGCWDDWEQAALVAKWHEGTLSWGDLYAAQIQHRIVVPRLIILALTHVSGGDFRAEQWFTFALFALNAVLLWKLLSRSMGDSGWKWPLMFAFNLMIFCPIHYQILFWGACFWTTMPMPCVLGILLTIGQERWPHWVRFLVTLVLAQIATHSFAHGLAVWPLMLVYLLVDPAFARLRTRLVYAGTWLLIGGITMACYFTNFINVAYHAYNLKPGDHAMKGASSLLEGDNLQQAIHFFFAFTGTWFARNPFAGHPLETAHILGLVTVAVVAVVALVAVVNKSARASWQHTLPWLALAAYVTGVSLMISKRGGDIGDHRAVTPRYLAVSEYMLISTVALIAILGTRMSFANAARQQALRLTGAVLLTVFCILQLPVWQYGLHLTDVWHNARRQAQATFLFLPHLKDQSRMISMKTLCKSYEYCSQASHTLENLNLLKTRPVATPDLKWFEKKSKPLPEDKAEVTTATITAEGTLSLRGLARFGPGQPVDAVLITQGDRVLSLGQPTPQPLLRIYALDYEFSNVEDVPVRSMYPWEAAVALPASVTDGSTLQLWVLNVQTRVVTPLKTSLIVNRAGGQAVIQP